MQEHRGRYSVREMAGLFGVTSGAYYRWAKNRGSERRRQRDARLLCLIRNIQRQHHNRHDSLRVREALRKEHGEGVSRKKVAALLREHGLNARMRRRFIPTTNSQHGLAVCANLLDRVFHAEAGGQK